VVVVVVVVIGLMVKGTRILVVDPPKSWLRVPQKVMPRNPDKLAYAKSFPWRHRSKICPLLQRSTTHDHLRSPGFAWRLIAVTNVYNEATRIDTFNPS